MQTQPTTPFGRRSLSLAMVASQASARDFAGKPGSSETVVHKWRLFRALTEAKAPLGVTDRALSVLHALLSFHQETALTLPAADRPPTTKTGRGAPASSCSRPIGNCRSAPMAWRRRRCAAISPASSRPD